MARINLRLRAWGWLTRRMVPVGTMSEAELIAVQARRVPANAVTRWLFGAVRRGRGDRPDGAGTRRRHPGSHLPAGRRPQRQRRRSVAARPLVVYFHGGGFVARQPGHGAVDLRPVAARVGAVVVSVDYRLAPSHRVPRRGGGLLRRPRLGGSARGRAGRDRADRGDGGERGRQPGDGGLPGRPRAWRAGGQPPGAHLPGHRHDGRRKTTAGPSDAVPVRRRTRRLSAALPRSRTGTPRNPWASPLLADHGGLPRRWSRWPSMTRSATAASATPRRCAPRASRAAHRVRRHAARLRQLPRPVRGRAPGHGRGLRRAVSRSDPAKGERRVTQPAASSRDSLVSCEGWDIAASDKISSRTSGRSSRDRSALHP